MPVFWQMPRIYKKKSKEKLSVSKIKTKIIQDFFQAMFYIELIVFIKMVRVCESKEGKNQEK